MITSQITYGAKIVLYVSTMSSSGRNMIIMTIDICIVNCEFWDTFDSLSQNVSYHGNNKHPSLSLSLSLSLSISLSLSHHTWWNKCVSLHIYMHAVRKADIILQRKLMVGNKNGMGLSKMPVFCLGSFGDSNATTKLLNKPSLKHSWITLKAS